MTDLSPAAQAVLDALYMDELNGPQQLMARAHAAAALRSAAEHLSYLLPFEDSACVDVADLLAIANELEGE